MLKVRHQLATNYFAQRLKAPRQDCARGRTEGSIAAGSLRHACGQVRDNDAIPRQRANDRYSALFSHNRGAGP